MNEGPSLWFILLEIKSPTKYWLSWKWFLREKIKCNKFLSCVETCTRLFNTPSKGSLLRLSLCLKRLWYRKIYFFEKGQALLHRHWSAKILFLKRCFQWVCIGVWPLSSKRYCRFPYFVSENKYSKTLIFWAHSNMQSHPLTALLLTFAAKTPRCKHTL